MKQSQFKLRMVILAIAIVMSGGCTLWQQAPTTTDVENPKTVVDANQIEQQPVVIEEKGGVRRGSATTTTTTKAIKAPQFDTIDKYVSLAVNTNDQYKTSKPAGFERVKFGTDVDVAPDGTMIAHVFVLAGPDWGSGNMEDVRTFYLEVVGPSPCWTTPDTCKEPNTVNYYGPFSGKLGSMLQ